MTTPTLAPPTTAPRVADAPPPSGVAGRLVWLLPALCLLLVAVMSCRSTPAADLFWQIKTGELIWTTGRVPQHDVFSFTSAGRPWQVQEWLSGLLFYGLFRGLSADVLVAFKVAVASLVFALVLCLCWLRCHRWPLTAGVTALAALAARPWFDMRPQMFTYLLLAVSLLILEQWRRGTWPRAIWLLPPITLLWVNLHGGFMLIFALLAVEIAGSAIASLAGSGQDRRAGSLAVVAGLCALCGLINPRGLEAYRYAFLLLGHHDMVNYIQEWCSPNFQDRLEKPLGYLILLLALCGTPARGRRACDLLLTAVLLHAALFSHRHVPLLAIGCAPVVAERLGARLHEIQRWLAARHASQAVWNAAATLALGALLVTCLARQAGELHLLAALRSSVRGEPRGSWFSRSAGLGFFPIYAAEFLSSQPSGGRLFNDYGWGGYCDWRLWPRYHVFIDGRAEVFFETSYWDYQRITRLEPGWQEKLRRWQVDTVLVPPGVRLAGALATDPQWRPIYQDKRAVVYRRVDTIAGTPDLPQTAAIVGSPVGDIVTLESIAPPSWRRHRLEAGATFSRQQREVKA